VLVTPVSGTVVAVEAGAGESVGTGVLLTLADLEEPQVQFWVEEADLASVAPGNKVNIVFEALPDYTYSGEIVSVDPMLVTVDGTPAVQSYASIDLAHQTGSAPPITLLSGMNAEVEVVAGEARNAVLVPIQALREIAPDQYAVFVVGADGDLEMRIVEVGLKDFVNAEILSGLETGEAISLGTEDSSDTTAPDPSEQPEQPGMMRFFGG
jgi:multidrug efflux pump subunit AcrA (membrane-fusion protein)